MGIYNGKRAVFCMGYNQLRVLERQDQCSHTQDKGSASLIEFLESFYSNKSKLYYAML
jgi:hypothetical protein